MNAWRMSPHVSLCGRLLRSFCHKGTFRTQNRIHDQYLQSWQEEINMSSKALFYRIIKDEPSFEEYLDSLPFKHRNNLIRFRVSNHSLPIETGRWHNIKREERICPYCRGNVLGDEFHFILECPNFEEDRIKYIKRHIYIRPNILKLQTLFKTKNKNSLTQLSIFIAKIDRELKLH